MNNNCIKFLQMYAFWSLLSVIVSFMLSYAFVFVYANWGIVGWVVPLFVAQISTFVFSILLAYYLFVIFNKSRVLRLYFLEKEYKIYKNKFICLLGAILLCFMLVVDVLSIYPILITIFTYLILLIINNILNKEKIHSELVRHSLTQK